MSDKTQEISLKTLLVPSKEVEVEYPGYEGFKLTLGFVSRESSITMRKKAVKVVIKGRQTSEEFNEDLFLELYCAQAIKGWSGLKFSYINTLVPVDVSAYAPDDFLAYSKENALMLVKNSPEFDAFITETVGDLGKFTKNS